MAESIDLSQLLDAREIPAPPSSAHRILQIKNDPDAGVSDLVEAVLQSPGLAAKILSTANSPVYRRGDEVTSVERAIPILGFRSVTTIALAFSVGAAMPSDGTIGGIPLTSFWSRSISTAATARLVAGLMKPMVGDEAFFVGLVAELGRMAMGIVLGEEYEALVADRGGWPSHADEREVFGFSSAETTGGLLRQWGMPELIATAAERIESADQATPPTAVADEVARIVRLSTEIAAFFIEEGDGLRLRELVESAKGYGLEEDEINQLLDHVDENVEGLAAQFEVSTDTSYAEVIAQAKAQLVELSLQTDAEWHLERERRAELEVTNKELESQARHDPLTGLFNRRAFDEQFGQHLNLRIRDPRSLAKPMGVIMIDIDHFKSVNDTYGHDAGDEVLKRLAELLKLTTRTEETVARYGGEEFILLMPLVTEQELLSAGERIRTTIENIDVEIPSGEILTITASLGAATMLRPTSADDGTQLIKAADEALYEAKKGGRNRVVLSTSALP